MENLKEILNARQKSVEFLYSKETLVNNSAKGVLLFKSSLVGPEVIMDVFKAVCEYVKDVFGEEVHEERVYDMYLEVREDVLRKGEEFSFRYTLCWTVDGTANLKKFKEALNTALTDCFQD